MRDGGVRCVSVDAGMTAGMVGTVKSKHHEVAAPTRLSLVGYVCTADGIRLNLKKHLFHRTTLCRLPLNLIFVVGTGMNCGKTTTAARLTHALSRAGRNVTACKLTGSVSNRDQDELAAAASHQTVDFSDFGFPSTYLCTKEELLALFRAMIAQVMDREANVVLVELADGLLQRKHVRLYGFKLDPKQRHRNVQLAALAERYFDSRLVLSRLLNEVE